MCMCMCLLSFRLKTSSVRVRVRSVLFFFSLPILQKCLLQTKANFYLCCKSIHTDWQRYSLAIPSTTSTTHFTMLTISFVVYAVNNAFGWIAFALETTTVWSIFDVDATPKIIIIKIVNRLKVEKCIRNIIM